jgi:hypothetical protein
MAAPRRRKKTLKSSRNPKDWGPLVWKLLHIMSFKYPGKPTESDKRAYRRLIRSVGKVLPCPACRINFRVNLKRCRMCPDDFANRPAFVRLVWRLHNEVNKKLNKKTVPFNITSLRKKYAGK